MLSTADLSPQLRRALRIVEQAANVGDPCPSNEIMAHRMGIQSTGTASGYLSTLQQRGFIAVERGQRSRVVIITATGKRTAGEIGDAHSARGKRAIYRKRAAEKRQKPLLAPVSRDPCPRCGARPEFGRRHSGARLAVPMTLSPTNTERGRSAWMEGA